MKTKHLLILLTISIIIYVSNYFFYNNSNSLNNYLIESSIEKYDFKIEIYNSEKKNFDIISLNSSNSELDESDYIEEIIKHMPFYNANYKFLAAYNLKKDNKNTLIIKLSYEFYNLSKENLEILKKSFNKTLLSNFKIDEIIIEIDSN